VQINMYALANFLSTREVDVVPDTWLYESRGQMFCKWPPCKTAARVLKAKLASELPTDQWTSHLVRILYKMGKRCCTSVV